MEKPTVTIQDAAATYLAGGAWLARNLNTGMRLPYRRKVWDCICHYYGEPDYDEWGKPPTVS